MMAIAFVAGSICILAQTQQTENKWTITIQVTDEAGAPVSDAKVSVGYYTTNSTPANIDGLSDTNGIFVASHEDVTTFLGHDMGFVVEKSGYYRTWVHYDLGPGYDAAKWNSTTNLTLKKIGNPIPMYAKKVETKTPKEDERLGFDLTVGDWIAPYGAGKTADLFFFVHRKVANAHEYDAEVKLTFPNKGDGIAIAPTQPDVGSDFKTSRMANENGYEPERTWHYSNTETPESVFGYFIRVRTMLDENGNVKSALYGKINGDIRFYVGTKAPHSGIGFTYCLNPTPNSRNVEFDPGKNLLQGLPFIEQVREP
jgi:hypothetical protein